MDFCTAICAKIDKVDLVAQAEQVGVTHFGAGDGPLLFSDPFQYLALAAQQTSSIKLGTMVTNPLTRIAPVTANAIATLSAIAPGRAFVGLGTANNALRSMGHAPARVADLDHCLSVVRGLLAGERVPFRWRGREEEVEFLAGTGYYDVSQQVPMWVAAGGPKVLRLAAEKADAVVCCAGPQPEFIQLVRRELDQAVAAAGRPPGSVKLIAQSWFYQLRSGETYEDAILKGFGSGPISSCIANLPLMTQHGDELGREIVEASRAAATAYLGDPRAADARHHLDVWRAYMKGFDPAHKSLITKYLVDYWCLYGTPDELREKAQIMMDNGVDMISVMFSDPSTAEQSIADIGTSILADR